jgi:hypothetical protein
MLKRDAPAESDSFPWISGRDDTYTTYPADYPFPEAIEAAKELSASATKRDRAADGPDSFPWIDARSVGKRDVAADGTDSFPWIDAREETWEAKSEEIETGAETNKLLAI